MGYYKDGLLETPEAGNAPSIVPDLKKLAEQINATFAALENVLSQGPKVAGVSPTEGTHLGGTPFTIKGSGFIQGSTVTIGAKATSIVVVSHTEITGVTAGKTGGGTGAAEVVVSTGLATSTGGPNFNYT